METNREIIDNELADVIIEKPIPFHVKDMQFYIYPVTFAKRLILSRHYEALGINESLLKANMNMEMLRLAKAKRGACCHIIALVSTPNNYESLFDYEALISKKDLFTREMTVEDIASMLVIALSEDKYTEYAHVLGIDKEQERMRRAMQVKNNKNSISFGGKSLFGTFIQPLKEMGYTDKEILYEKSYTFLRLMLADKITSMYFSDDEYKRLHVSVRDGNEEIIRPTKENMERIRKMDWT